MVRDDGHRNRLTALARPILVIPHLIWLLVWGIAANLAVIVSWFATLFAGRTPDGLHGFIARYTRYLTHVRAYMVLAANPYPGFLGDDEYPVYAQIAPPAEQNRWITGFRLVLAIPAAIVTSLLGHLLDFLALFAWVVSIVIGRMPLGFESFLAWCLRFELQTWSYLALLTDRYPSFSPGDGDVAAVSAKVSSVA